MAGKSRKDFWLEAGIAALLFLGTAAVVIWQNSRVGILWDISYILENSYRISLGDVPYRDFPFPYAPVTFLVQAAIIELTGRVFWHHILYCAIVGGLGTVLTWKIVLQIFRDRIAFHRLTAFLLALTLTILGIYCIYPHPFYDPDCTFVVLICIFLLLHLEQKNFPVYSTFLAGIFLVLPVFVKQNTGLAFLGSIVLGLLALIGVDIWRRQSIRGYLVLIGGIIFGLAATLLLIHFTAGLENYRLWTVSFAAQRRTPSLADMLTVYQSWSLLLWIVLFAISAFLALKNRNGNRFLGLISVSLALAPFAWSVFYPFLDADASERAERLQEIFPFVLIVSFALAVLTARRRSGVRLLLPFVLIATINGAFLSQQLWGSTYALWSLLVLLIADIFFSLFELLEIESGTAIIAVSAVIAATLAISGGFYMYSNERLDYVNLSEGNLVHSNLPELKGLSVRGSWLPDFEELISYAERGIPRDDGIMMLPGEDLFYYTTGRRPAFPVLMFDHTVNPYSPEEILELARQRDIRWLIIKNDLQLDEEPMEDKERLVELLRQDFKQVDSLNDYEIYKRKMPGETDEQDENDDQNDQSDDSTND